MALRYGHSEGHTDICYSENFKYIVTCGSEGDVRIWDGVDDADQKDTCIGEKAWAVFQKDKNLYVATDTNIIQAYTFPDLETDGIITRFTAPATQIEVSADGNKLVASSCDMNIHVVDIQSLECKKLSGHRAPVLSVSIDPKCEFVASTSCDGTIRVWSLSTNNVVKQWDFLQKSNSFENSPVLCRIHFDHEGRSLAIPHENTIKIYKRETWSLVFTLTAPLISDIMNIVKFSPCGKLIAGGSTSGGVYVWALENTNVIAKLNADDKAICGIAWFKSVSIAFVNTNGQLGSLDIITPQMSEKEDETLDLGDVPLAEPEFEDDDEDNENAISLEKIKAETGFGIESGDSLKRASPVDEVDDQSSVVSESVLRPKFPISELQQPFQPSSTPVHLQQRFMAWNSVGIVRQFNMEDFNDIDVEFHDSSHHHAMRMNNLLGHTMASLTEKLLVLAAPKIDDNSSKLVCILLKPSDGHKEWDVSFGDEDILLVAGGDGWVAAVTDMHTLHIFSADGTQTDLLSLPGRPIAMAGNGLTLCIFCHAGLGLNGDQQMSYSEYKIHSNSKRATFISIKALPISGQSSLRWVGFTDEGSLATLDSIGILRILYSSLWRPVCFLDKQCKSEFDHYFVVGISEYSQNIRCILCKGAFYPPVTPKPLVTEVKWKVPLCELESDKSMLEEELLRTTITLPHIPSTDLEDWENKKKIEKSISVTVMKLFALACRNGFDSRAVSICEAMPSADVVSLAAKYAAKLGKHQLAEKVSEVANRMSFSSVEENVPEEIPEADQPEESSQDQTPSNYSQDMFEENNTVKENLILNMKKKKEQMSPKPFILRRFGNPFKKSRDVEPATSNGIDKNSENKPKFMDWYDSNKHRLQEEFPLLKESELIIASMKLYRQEISSKSNDSIKLSLDDTLNSTCNESLDESAIGLPSMESKKRKLDTEDSGQKKKISTSSKLKSFSFSKR